MDSFIKARYLGITSVNSHVEVLRPNPIMLRYFCVNYINTATKAIVLCQDYSCTRRPHIVLSEWRCPA